MSHTLLFHYLLLNMFRMLIHPSSGACDLFVELFHGLYCSGSMCVGVTLWFVWGGVVSGYHTTSAKPQLNSYQSNTTHEITQQISRKLLRMDVLTSKTCWAVNNEIIKQVTSSWSLFIQLILLLHILLSSTSIIKILAFFRLADRSINSRSIDVIRNISPATSLLLGKFRVDVHQEYSERLIVLPIPSSCQVHRNLLFTRLFRSFISPVLTFVSRFFILF